MRTMTIVVAGAVLVVVLVDVGAAGVSARGVLGAGADHDPRVVDGDGPAEVLVVVVRVGTDQSRHPFRQGARATLAGQRLTGPAPGAPTVSGPTAKADGPGPPSRYVPPEQSLCPQHARIGRSTDASDSRLFRSPAS